MCGLVFFPHFLRDISFKSRQNPRVDFFSGKKRPRRIQNAVFPFTVVEFCGRWIVYNSRLNSPRRGRFVNSAFPSKKNLAQKRSLFTTNKFESKCLQKFYVSGKHEKECYIENNVLPRGTESPFLSALHAKNDTTNHATADKRTHALLTETAFNHQLSTKQPSNVTTITLLKH